MSQRESVEKRFIFKGKEGKSIYVMSSSVPDNLFPDKDDVVKITNYINYYKLVDEGDFIGFYSLNQTDFKMPIPQFLINLMLLYLLQQKIGKLNLKNLLMELIMIKTQKPLFKIIKKN